TIVGWSFVPGNQQAHAFSWRAATGMVDLGTLGGTLPGLASIAKGVDGDGGVVVGITLVPGATNVMGANNLVHAFRSTTATGMVDLGSLEGPTGTSGAAAVNSDGSIIVGESNI